MDGDIVVLQRSITAAVPSTYTLLSDKEWKDRHNQNTIGRKLNGQLTSLTRHHLFLSKHHFGPLSA